MHPSADTGRVIAGRYRLQAPIGRGAMGVVWRARDQLLDRDVAIKEVQIADTLTEAERATAFQRTLREAKTAARLNHPAVVTVYDVAEDGGRPWIVMQLVHAQSLDQVLADSGPLSPRRAAEMARQLLSALSVAHAAGVMHRDVKPSNVLIGSDDRAVLTDFGIATFADDPKLTQTGMVMGSPGFTAPERIRGEDASPASDLWSLGATVYAAVEGHGPFEQRGGAITTMSAIINEDAPEAPTAGALGPVIAALLRREPADRPDASAAARMITDVLPLLADRAPGSPAGYEATALSASSPPAPAPVSPGSAPARARPVPPGSASPGSASPGSASPGLSGAVRPRTPVPDENSLAYQPTVIKPPDPPAANTGPPRGAPARPLPHRQRRRRRRPPRPHRSRHSRRRRRRAAGGRGRAPGTRRAGSGSGPPPGQAGGIAARFLLLVQPVPQVRARRHRRVPVPATRPGGLRPGGLVGPGVAAAAGLVRRRVRAAPAAAVRVRVEGRRRGAGDRRRGGRGGHRRAPAPGSFRLAAGSGPRRVRARVRRQDRRPGRRRPRSRRRRCRSSTPINKPATGSLPSGFTMTSQPAASNETAGFTIAVPPNWQKSTSGYQTYLTDPADSNTNVLIDLTPHTYPDMLREAQYIEAQSIPRFPGYHRVGMAATPVRGTTGAWWKFTWNKKGVQQEALDLLFVLHTSAGPQSYALYVTAPESKFDQMRPIFDEEAETFATLPG